MNAAHGPVFAGVAALLLYLWPAADRAGRTAALGALALALGLGILVEVLQTISGRPGSIYDVMTDAAGAVTGLALWHLVRGRSRGWLAPAVALAGCTVIGWDPTRVALAYASRAESFPVLAQFDARQDLTFVASNGASDTVERLPARWARTADERALRVACDAQRPPVLHVIEPIPDWRGYAAVAIDLTNPLDRELRLTVRVFDDGGGFSHDEGSRRSFAVAPLTRATVRVPLVAAADMPARRHVDLARVARLMVIGRKIQEPTCYFVSRIWLE
ncbi:MAG: hypothetical protein EPO25_14985 [Gammaproteobacteria bacterium]|nr:MAG: hypothetical protein EPO25_14985 [Gammaproteobacteria bacterium]